MRRGSFLGNDPFRPVIPDEQFLEAPKLLGHGKERRPCPVALPFMPLQYIHS